MINQYPLWKYILLIGVLIVGVLYALPNMYGSDPAVQVSALRGAEINATTLRTVEAALNEARIEVLATELGDSRILVRFPETDAQLRAQEVIKAKLGGDYVVALNLAPAVPQWLLAIGAKPMFLGLDLRGGVHFLLDVDVDAAVAQAEARYVDNFKGLFREEKLRYLSVKRRSDGGGVEIKLRNEQDREQARRIIRNENRDLLVKEFEKGGAFYLRVRLSEDEIREVKTLAVEQNITTLRNRVNELGVAEPIVQRQGERRIVVQLPGVQDTAQAKRILGATATLEFHLVDESSAAQEAMAKGRAPIGSKIYRRRDTGTPVVLKKRVIVTGDQIINAVSSIDTETGSPAVVIDLDGPGSRSMHKTTKENVGKGMAVVFIEYKTEERRSGGEVQKIRRKVEEVINVATIREPFSKRFQITGLDSPEEARQLALLLRAGALKAPMEFVEERTVGPSLGKENIEQGFQSVVGGFLLVLVFMAYYYRVFGLVANLALALNLVLIVAILSILQATLTLPGIAGIVLVVGMAVDANVLIYERIREEIRNGNSPQASIYAGYEKALTTIADANITTLIAAVVLFGLGTGPIKGFAVTLSIGILTSMFTAIMGTRAVVNLIYGGRRLKKLMI